SCGQQVVGTLADFAGAEVAPLSPPREQTGIVGIERPPQVGEARAEQRLEQRPLLGPLADRIELALLRVNVELGPRDIDVAAQQQLASLGGELARPVREPL